MTALQLELSGLAFPVNPGVAGSTNFYDRGCLTCPKIRCTCQPAVGKRELVLREARVERREAELERRLLAVAERERMLADRR